MVTPVLKGFGFKATYSDLTCCNDFQYEIGKVYKHTGILELCKSGFHLCKQLHQTFVFYSPMKSNRYFVVRYNDTTDNCIVSDKDNIVEYPKVITNAIRLEVEIKVEEHLEMSDIVKQYPTEHMLLYIARHINSPYMNDVLKMLLDAGADVHARDDYVLQMASWHGHTEIVKLLLDHGVDVHAKDDEALRSASECGHTEIVELLLNYGADVHALDNEALQNASYHGYTDTVKRLLQAGAKVHANNNKALQNARKRYYFDVEKLLLDASKNVHACN